MLEALVEDLVWQPHVCTTVRHGSEGRGLQRGTVGTARRGSRCEKEGIILGI
jgi:hypothetical protein